MNTFDAAAAREAADVAFRNALKVIAKDLSVFGGGCLLDFSSCFFERERYIYIYICVCVYMKTRKRWDGMGTGDGKGDREKGSGITFMTTRSK